jgi:hypothetical protein
MANVKISQLPSATTPLSGLEEIAIVQNNQTVKTTAESIRRGYKVYTALLTQSGGDNPQDWDSGSGSLILGYTYQIASNDGGTADFTNVGAPNNNVGTYFVATGTTPNSWGDSNNGGLSGNGAAPVVATMLENTIGNIWFTYIGPAGVYNVNSSSLFTASKTWTNPTILDNINLQLSMYRFTDSLLYLVDANGNGGLLETSIEIRVYN